MRYPTFALIVSTPFEHHVEVYEDLADALAARAEERQCPREPDTTCCVVSFDVTGEWRIANKSLQLVQLGNRTPPAVTSLGVAFSMGMPQRLHVHFVTGARHSFRVQVVD